MSNIQKALELEGLLLRSAEEKLLALEAENAALRKALEQAMQAAIDATRKE